MRIAGIGVTLSTDLMHRVYNTTLRAIVPLPDPDAHPSNPSHLNAYQEFPVGSIVLALYPDTSCFYRAEVLASPRDMQLASRVRSHAKILRSEADGSNTGRPTVKARPDVQAQVRGRRRPRTRSGCAMGCRMAWDIACLLLLWTPESR